MATTIQFPTELASGAKKSSKTAMVTTAAILNKTETPKESAKVLRSLFEECLEGHAYQGVPKADPVQAAALLNAMYKRAVATGVPIGDVPLSQKGFRLAFSYAVMIYPGHPLDVQAWIGEYTWLVVQIDDTTKYMRPETEDFQRRFITGEKQANVLLEALAQNLRESYKYFDKIMANILICSSLSFISSNPLELREEFQSLQVTTPEGQAFPYWYRNLSGIPEAFGIMLWPQSMYPDMGAYLEALPDMAVWINLLNDALSFYKEEVAGETRNYVHNRAICERRSAIEVFKDMVQETIDSANRVNAILAAPGRQIYAKAWDEHVRGYIALHTVNPRYKLSEIGLGEPHPLEEDWETLLPRKTV